MMQAQVYPWLTPYWQNIQTQLNAARLHHALFITSANGMGKLAFAQYLAQTLLCKEPVGWEPCKHCHSCQLFETSVHPDFHFITSEEDRAIPVDSIRGVSQKLNEHAQLAGNKVVIIEHAENLNLASANALLKTLEEPTNGSYLILLAKNKSQVLPTINSRCQKLHFSAPSADSTLAWLINQFPITAATETAIRVNHNAPLHTLRYLNNGDDDLRKELFSHLQNMHKQPDAITRLAEIFSEHTLERLTWLQFVLMDIQKIQSGINLEYVINADQQSYFAQLTNKLSLTEAQYLQSELLILKTRLVENNNLTINTLVLNFLIKLKRTIN